ncbi:MAG: DUF917 family protein [Deltaproteobacteria bacterium]|nr:DUF917 family protein [Deltaproteobacteria bacterium]MBW1962569.1 DUF917 family protein [Deltaproteobacteria bacterium]MBW1994151.1 DUF917 family protein [Deltaproteobacteria bacterium]MBW2153943.1 DUF917 family protein [Deltaproteobacteria bacterium]
MSKIKLTEDLAEAAVYGGAVLGGGGGGNITDGLNRAKLAVQWGNPVLVSIDEFDDDAILATASVVGAPAAKERFLRPKDHIRALELLLDTRPYELSGIIANENGASSGINGWLQAAAMDLPVVDAPCNGRAHPSGLMGAMGINRLEGYLSIQTAAGGNPATGRYLEVIAEGRLETTANMIRYASVQAGGMVAVARDPLDVGYLRKHAAPGATGQAIRLGRQIISTMEKGAEAVMDVIVSELKGKIACRGRITRVKLETVGGYDVGLVKIEGDKRAEISFWNEFMTLEWDGKRHATFPDLITFLSLESGLPVSSAEIKEDQEIGVLVVDRKNLILGEGVRIEEALKEAEFAVGKPLINP